MKRRSRGEDSRQKGGSGAPTEAPAEGAEAAEDVDGKPEYSRRRSGCRGVVLKYSHSPMKDGEVARPKKERRS